MLFGAFLAVAPAASGATPTSIHTYSGNPTCQDFGYTFGLKDDSVITGGSSEKHSGNGVEVTYHSYLVDGVRYFDVTVTATDASKAVWCTRCWSSRATAAPSSATRTARPTARCT